jgi:hypothetical protein
MAANRINRVTALMSAPNPPQKPVPSLTIPPGFVVCPAELAVAQPWQQALYRQAYEQAQAAVQIPRHYRLLFSVWN